MITKNYNERILYNKCPLCGSEKFSDFYLGNCSKHPSYKDNLDPIIKWMKCESCSHVFTNGYYNEETLQKIFSVVQKNQNVGHDIEKNRVISSKIIDKIFNYKSDGYWLDIGFGNGSLLFTAHEYGYIPVGLDLRKQNISQMKYFDIECYDKDIEEFQYKQRFSVISMADVLEHTRFPVKVLISVRKLLKKNGIIFISLPNSETKLWEIATKQNANPYWGEMEHYHNFSRSRLFSLLKEQGFKTLSYGISERYRMCMEIIASKNE